MLQSVVIGMKGIESTDKTFLENLNKRINDFLLSNVKDYNAERYGYIVKHKREEKYLLILNENDPRLPLRTLNSSEKTEIKDYDLEQYEEPFPIKKLTR